MGWLSYALAVANPIDWFIYHRWLPDDKGDSPPPPAATLPIPRVDDGAPLPLIYGRVRCDRPTLVWFGTVLVPGQSWTDLTTAGHTADHFSLDVLLVIGVPFFGATASGAASLVGMWLGDTPATSFTITSSFSGGCVYEIGPSPGNHTTDILINGTFLGGYTTQDALAMPGVTPPTWKDTVAYNTSGVADYTMALAENSDNASLVPGYRNQCIAFMHCGIGASPNLPAFSFEVRSLSTNTASDMGHSLTDDACPAAVIYDLLTSTWGKLALPTSKIDIPSFQAASTTLFNEGHGYSRLIDQETDATELINDVLRQIDAVLYEEPTTGKLVLRLIRNDYSIQGLDDINPDNAEPGGSNWYSNQGWNETLNQVRVIFQDRTLAYANSTAVSQNMANAIAQGSKLRSVDITYEGCKTSALAQKLASRESATISRPTVKATLKVSRAFYAHRPGDVVTFTWPQLNISAMIMRIVRMDFGSLHDNGITVDLIREVFATTVGGFPVVAPV